MPNAPRPPFNTALARDVLRIAQRDVMAENDRLRAALRLVLDRAVSVPSAEPDEPHVAWSIHLGRAAMEVSATFAGPGEGGG